MFLFCCCEYFTSLAGDYRSREMKEIPIRKGAAFFFYCTWALSGCSVSHFHCKTNAITPLCRCHSNHTSLPAPIPDSLYSHLPWHEQSTWTTDIGWGKEKTVILCSECTLLCCMQQSHETIDARQEDSRCSFSCLCFKNVPCGVSVHILLPTSCSVFHYKTPFGGIYCLKRWKW